MVWTLHDSSVSLSRHSLLHNELRHPPGDRGEKVGHFVPSALRERWQDG